MRNVNKILLILIALFFSTRCLKSSQENSSHMEIKEVLTPIENSNIPSDFQDKVNAFWKIFSINGLETIYGEWVPLNFNQYTIKNKNNLVEVKFYESTPYSKELQLMRTKLYKDNLLQKEIYSATETSISSYSYDEFARIQKVEYKDSLYDFQYKDIPHQNTFIRYTYVNNKLTSTTTITKTDFGYEMNIKDEKTKFPELYRYFYEDEKLTKVEIDYSFQDSIIPSHIFEYKYLPSGMVARETVYLPDGETIYNYKEQKEIDSTIEILIQDNNIYAPSESKIILSEIDASGNWHYGVEIQDGKIINTYKRDIIYTNDIVSEL